MFVIALHTGKCNVVIVLGRKLIRTRPRTQAAFTAVVAHPIHVDVFHNRLVVNVGDVNATEIGNRPVVVEGATAPVATLKTNTAVPVPVVNTTVEAYVGAPVA